MSQRRDQPWIFRTYAGHSSARASNELYRANLAAGQTGLSIAFDLPTQCGYDPDHPLARPEGLSELMDRVTADETLRKRIVEAVRKANTALSRVESVKRVVLLNRDLSLEEDEVTPTLKVKRKNLEKKFASVFDKLYEDPSTGLVVMDRGEE